MKEIEVSPRSRLYLLATYKQTIIPLIFQISALDPVSQTKPMDTIQITKKTTIVPYIFLSTRYGPQLMWQCCHKLISKENCHNSWHQEVGGREQCVPQSGCTSRLFWSFVRLWGNIDIYYIALRSNPKKCSSQRCNGVYKIITWCKNTVLQALMPR